MPCLAAVLPISDDIPILPGTDEEQLKAELGLPVERAHTVMEEWGYTGSACVPMAFHDAMAKGKAGPGDLVVFIGSGVGYNQAGAAFRLR